MRAERAGQLAGLALGLLVVGWLVFADGEDDAAAPARDAREARAGTAADEAAREAERRRAARAREERERAKLAGRTHGRERGEDGDGRDPRERGAAWRPPTPEDDASKGPLGKSHVMPLHLNQLVRAPDRAVVEISGLDPEPPRELIAWRIKDGKSAILVRGESDESGQLHFPPVVAAGSGLEIVITGADGRPELPGASEVQRLAPRPPEAPQARVLEVYEDEALVRVAPTEASGAVLIADLDGTLLGRYPISPRPPVGTRAFDVAIELYGDEVELLMAHEFDDGRRSDWRALSLVEPGSLGVLLEVGLED